MAGRTSADFYTYNMFYVICFLFDYFLLLIIITITIAAATTAAITTITTTISIDRKQKSCKNFSYF